HRVPQLDVDAQIVRVELERISRAQRVRLVDGEIEPGEITFERELPVVVAAGVGLERERLPGGFLYGGAPGVQRYNGYCSQVPVALYCRGEIAAAHRGRPSRARAARSARPDAADAGRSLGSEPALPGSARGGRRQYLGGAARRSVPRPRYHSLVDPRL